MTANFRICPASRSGFTLLEMLTATAVLVLLVALLAPIFSSLTSTTSNSTGKLGIDLLARQALDRIGRDLALMPQRGDLDYFLNKQIGNDEISFFSSVPGVFPASGGGAGDPASGLSLVAYRVANGALERMAVAQSFDALTFLTYDSDGNLLPDTGITRAVAAASDSDYQTLCERVFRFELGFLLKDGTYEPLPLDAGKNPPNSADPGYREWSPAPHGFARVRVPDGPSNTVFRPLGWQDVAAVVVTIAVIDPVNSARTTATQLESLGALMPDAVSSTDPTNLSMPGTTWKSQLEGPSPPGIPEPVVRAVRVYQRSFYLDSPRK
jgi:prepilin-type N-terminal cleavage/methylation domain-containing protein